MSGDSFTQLRMRELDANLEEISVTRAEHAGAIMTRYEQLLVRAPSDLCVVVGDAIPYGLYHRGTEAVYTLGPC